MFAPSSFSMVQAETIVLPVKIIMSPTSSSMPFAGRKARSATLRTNFSPLVDGVEGYATACTWHKREP